MMKSDNLSYPAAPLVENPEIIAPPAGFKAKTRAVIFAIVVFFFLYLAIVAAGAAIAVLCFAVCSYLIAEFPYFLTYVISFGIAVAGLVSAAFALKLLFSRYASENPVQVEITEVDQPKLFQFIREIAGETNSPMPHKIYLSAGVNASVFFKAGFWSVFFTPRKNLEIGLGLVNTLSISEFKAVIGHEFGHFSQKNLRLGTYIYSANRVIFSLIYSHDSFDKLLSKWLTSGGLPGRFAHSVIVVMQQVRVLLGIAHEFVLKKYLGMSRTMEFHADLVAASVAGPENLKTALRKIEFSSFCWEHLNSVLNHMVADQKKSSNVIENHTATLELLASVNKIKITNGNFEITDDDLERAVIKTRINLENQWASHPTTQEREENINRLKASSERTDAPAWSLFDGSVSLQRSLTVKLYAEIPGADGFNICNGEEYRKIVVDLSNRFQIAEDYNNFFDQRFLRTTELPKSMDGAKNYHFADIFKPANSELIKRAKINKHDLTVLEHIRDKKIPFKYFEFDGVKYHRKDCERIIGLFEQEASLAEEQIEQMDQAALAFFAAGATKLNKTVELTAIFDQVINAQNALKCADEMIQKMHEFHVHLGSRPQWQGHELDALNADLRQVEKDIRKSANYLSSDLLGAEFSQGAEDANLVKGYLETDGLISEKPFGDETIGKITQFGQMIHFAVSNVFGHSVKRITEFGLEIKNAEKS